MTDGAPNIIGPIGGLMGIGIMALAAKGVIDIVKEQSEKKKRQSKGMPYREPYTRQPRIESTNRIDRGLNRMLGR